MAPARDRAPRRQIATVLAAGLLVVAGARVMAPGAPPLYDGVVPLEAYLWLNPPPGQAGGPKGATADIPLVSGASDLVAVATGELQPQAQIFATPGSLTLAAGATSVKVSIEPVLPVAPPPEGHFSGNVYRILVTDDQGRPVTAPAAAKVSVVLRAADPTLASASIGEFRNGAWQVLPASVGGFGATFIAVVTDFGDFAVIAAGPDPFATASPPASGLGTTSPAPASASPGPSGPASTSGSILGSRAWLLGGLGILIVAVVVTGLVTDRRRRERERANKRGWRR